MVSDMSILNSHNLGNVWSRSGGSANGVLNARRLSWMSTAERRRAEMLRQARLLFEGKHRKYYVDEQRSAHSFPPLRQGEPPYFQPYNLLTLIAEKMADILFGESPRIYIDDKQTQERIDAITERSWLMAQLIDSGAECGWGGETFFEIKREGGNARIAHVPVDQMWPQGLPGADQQHREYVRYATHDVKGEGTAKDKLLLETRYTAGRITRKLYRLGHGAAGDMERSESLDLSLWPERTFDNQPLAEELFTGLSRPSIIRVPNGFGGRSDYDGLIEAQDSLHAANTQIGRVLAKHADPRLAAPTSAVDPKTGTVPVGAEVFFFRTKEDIPQYITWDAELASAMEDRQFKLTALATMAEMPLSLLGVKDDSSVETAAKMRLAAAPALAKGQRKAVVWRQAIKMAIALAVEAETGVSPTIPIGVEMRDGLPDDQVERATVISMLREAGVMSRKRGLREQWLDAGAIQDEEAELDRDAAGATPSVLFEQPNSQGNDQ